VVKISVVINTLNEEKNLPGALESLKSFADELIVVDMHSEDKTVEIAKKYGAEVFLHERTGYVEPARNFAIRKAAGEWILILDADERLSLNLKECLRKIVNKPEADYYRTPRKNIIFGKWIKHSRWWPDYNIRFFRKGHVEWNEIIHSVPTTKGVGADLEASEKYAIVHHHYDSVEQYIERLNRYTTHQAKNLIKNKYKFKWSDLIYRPTSEFNSRYFQGEGYKDGIHGLALAGLQSFSEFVTYLKVWSHSSQSTRDKEVDIEKIVNAIKENQSDVNYWTADTLIKNGAGMMHKVKRKFKLQ
jgi:glycosyltransferase involved in cell wall biosynthesis